MVAGSLDFKEATNGVVEAMGARDAFLQSFWMDQITIFPLRYPHRRVPDF